MSVYLFGSHSSRQGGVDNLFGILTVTKDICCRQQCRKHGHANTRYINTPHGCQTFFPKYIYNIKTKQNKTSEQEIFNFSPRCIETGQEEATLQRWQKPSADTTTLVAHIVNCAKVITWQIVHCIITTSSRHQNGLKRKSDVFLTQLLLESSKTDANEGCLVSRNMSGSVVFCSVSRKEGEFNHRCDSNAASTACGGATAK